MTDLREAEVADRATLRAKSARYDARAIFYHWAVAALVAIVGTIGLLLHQFPRSAAPGLLTIHAIFGLTILALAAARIRWRMTHTPPDLPESVGEFGRRAAHAAHMGLYALIVLTPLVGVVDFVAHNHYFDFGFVHLGFPATAAGGALRRSGGVHKWLAYCLMGLAGVHVLAALWHQFVRRDRLLVRMAPPNRRSRATSSQDVI